jgi:hypothetical protein
LTRRIERGRRFVEHDDVRTLQRLVDRARLVERNPGICTRGLRDRQGRERDGFS